jgi:hypothetical protein
MELEEMHPMLSLLTKLLSNNEYTAPLSIQLSYKLQKESAPAN